MEECCHGAAVGDSGPNRARSRDRGSGIQVIPAVRTDRIPVPVRRLSVKHRIEVAFVAAYPEKAVLEATALQVGLEFPVDMVGQGFALPGQLAHQSGKVLLDKLVE